jgi:hypothetical protein
MEREQVEHVVKKANARGALTTSVSVQPDSRVDVRLGGFSIDLGDARHRR